MASKPATEPALGKPSDSAETSPQRKGLGPLTMVWRAGAAYPSRVLMALTALVITAGTTAALPWGFRQVVDKGFARGSDTSTIDHWFIVLFGMVVVLALGTAVRFYNVSWLGERVVADIRQSVQANLLRLPPSFFEANSPKEISSRMTADTALIEQVVGTTVSVALRNLITALIGVMVLFSLAPQLTAGLLVAVPVVVLPIVWFSRRMRAISRSSQDRIADIGALVTEVLGATRVVQAYNQEARESDRFAAAVERSFATARRRIWIRSVMTSVVIFLAFGALTVLMWRGAVGVAEGRISGGTIAQFVLTGAIVAAYHAGAEWKFWPGPQTCAAGRVPVLTGADILDALSKKGHPPSCEEAAWRMAGISMAGYNALISAALAGASFLVAARRRPHPDDNA